MPDKPSELKPCQCGDSGPFVGYCRCALVEVARRALLFADLGSYDMERLPQEITDKYLAEQAGKEAE